MAPAIKTLSVWRGNSEVFDFRLKQSDKTAVDLTGYELVLTIVHGGGTLTRSTADDGLQMDDPTTGEVICKLTPAETRLICDSPIDGARYELEVRSADVTEQRTILAGKIKIEGGANGD